MPQLKNYREVGIFDLMSAPLNPIGAFDAEQFKKDVRALLAEKTDEKFLAVDLTGLDFVYSDAYNAFIQFQQEMEDRKGLFAVLTNNQTIIDGLKNDFTPPMEVVSCNVIPNPEKEMWEIELVAFNSDLQIGVNTKTFFTNTLS